MYKWRLYFKSKEFLMTMLIIIVCFSYGMYSYFHYAYFGSDYLQKMVNRFSFWYYIRHYDLGSLVMFLSPIMISLLTITNFYEKMKGNYIKYALLKNNYKKVMFKETIFAYLKAYLPFFITSIITFIIGSIFFSSKILNNDIASRFTNFDLDGIKNPYTYVILSHITLFFYTILVTNLGLIILKITKKLNVSLILTFVFLNAINFLIGNISTIVEIFIQNKNSIEYLYYLNVYEGYIVRSTIIQALIDSFIFAMISLVVYIILYHNKEKVVRCFE